MKKPEAVIFDMDGVLIDSEPIHYKIDKEVFSKLGIQVAADVHRTYLGMAGEFMYADLKARFELPETVSELLKLDELFRCEYFKRLTSLNPNEGVLNFLNELKSGGLKLAVATSSSPEMAKILINRCQLASCFDAIVTTTEAGKSKPEPDVYLLAAHKIGVMPSSCVVFEDSPIGLSAAKSAGMSSIALQTRGVDVKELSEAGYMIKTFKGMTISRLYEIYALI